MSPPAFATAVITGAASGIGRAVAVELARAGTRVMLADVDVDGVFAAAAEIRALGAEALTIAYDASEAADADRLAEAAFAGLGEVCLVVLNAGVGAGGALPQMKPQNFDWVFAVNVSGLFHGIRAFVPRMLAQATPSRIALTASEHAIGLPSRGGLATAYTASKHAVHGLAAGLRRDLANTALGVSLVCPGLVATAIWNSARARPARFGGPRALTSAPAEFAASGLAPDLAARRIHEQLAAGEFYVFTHGRDIREVAQARADEVATALDRFADRYGRDA